MEYGLPQGSVLSPLLFNFFINDIHNIKDNSLKIQYADDTVVCYTIKDLSEMPLISYNFSTIRDWLSDNNLSLNVAKTKLIIFQLRGLTKTHITVHECDNYMDMTCLCPKVESTEEVQYLGLTFHHNLRWDSHIAKLLRKLRAACSTIFALRSKINKRLLRSVYFAIFESNLRYGLLIYGGATGTLLDSVFKVQKKTIRIMNKVGSREHTKELFLNDDILNFFALYLQRAFNFFIKYNYLFQDDQIRNHFTRATNDRIKRPANLRFRASEQTIYNKILSIINSNRYIRDMCNNVQDRKPEIRSFLQNQNVEELKALLVL